MSTKLDVIARPMLPLLSRELSTPLLSPSRSVSTSSVSSLHSPVLSRESSLPSGLAPAASFLSARFSKLDKALALKRLLPAPPTLPEIYWDLGTTEAAVSAPRDELGFLKL